MFHYNGTALESLQALNTWALPSAIMGRRQMPRNQMAPSLTGAVARILTVCTKLAGYQNRKHAVLWIFQVLALTAGLFGCEVWATINLTFTLLPKLEPASIVYAF